MITLKSQSRVREIFNACLQQESDEQRCAVLHRECAGDAELRDSVLQLLEAYDASHSSLKQPLGHQAGLGSSGDYFLGDIQSTDPAKLPSVGNYRKVTSKEPFRSRSSEF